MSPQTPVSRRTLIAALAATPILSVAATSGSRAYAATADIGTRARYDADYAAFPITLGVSNEAGSLAWGTAYVMNSLVRMYEATCDPRYVDELARIGADLLAQRDSVRGVTDYQGRSGPVWRTAGNYTAGVAEIPGSDGTAVLDIRWAGSRAVEASVEVVPTSDTFTLHLHHPLATSRTLTGLSLDPASADFVETRIVAEAYASNARWTAVAHGTGAPAGGTYGFEPQYYAYAVHTGQISYPLAAFARLVKENPALSKHRRLAATFRQAAIDAVAFHDDEWVESGADRGDYVWPVGAPVPFDGTIQPFNQTQGLGQTMAELHRIEPNEAYANKLTRMVRSWRGDRRLEGEAAVWNYWPTYSELYRGWRVGEVESTYTPAYGASRQAEDVSHAAITVEFLRAAYAAGVEATETDLRNLAATYRDKVSRGADQIWGRVDGATEASTAYIAQIGRWLPIDQYGPGMEEHIRAVYRRAEEPFGGGSRLLNTAYLVWASVDGWGQVCRGRVPFPAGR